MSWTKQTPLLPRLTADRHYGYTLRYLGYATLRARRGQWWTSTCPVHVFTARIRPDDVVSTAETTTHLPCQRMPIPSTPDMLLRGPLESNPRLTLGESLGRRNPLKSSQSIVIPPRSSLLGVMAQKSAATDRHWHDEAERDEGNLVRFLIG